MESRGFKRTIEDFVCENCGKDVQGNGYTNHCPYCLCSKHVDIQPGDRAESCHGLMKPVDTLKDGQEQIIIQTCQTCGVSKRIRAAEGDSFDKIIEIARNKADNSR